MPNLNHIAWHTRSDLCLHKIDNQKSLFLSCLKPLHIQHGRNQANANFIYFKVSSLIPNTTQFDFVDN